MNVQGRISPTRKYFCLHCRDDPSRFSAYSFETLDHLYGHWMSNHTELPVSEPFMFYAVEFVGCHYCDYSGPLGSLKKHHKTNHRNQPLVITRQINREQCALCYYAGSDLVNHFVQTHQWVSQSDIFNPVCFTRDTLAELLAIDIHTERKCGHCGDSFETDHEINEHHFDLHAEQSKSVIEKNDEQPNQISYLICGLCDGVVAPQDYWEHIEMDQSIFQFPVDSHHNDPVASYYNKLYNDYLKTRVVFGNRLVAFKQNLIFSEYDDSKEFTELVDRIIANTFRNERS